MRRRPRSAATSAGHAPAHDGVRPPGDGERRGRIGGGAPADRRHGRDPRVGREGITELDQERGDPARIALAGVLERRVEPATEMHLGDPELVGPAPHRRGLPYPVVDERQSSGVGGSLVPRRDHGQHSRGRAWAVTEGGDRCRARLDRLVAIHGDLDEPSAGAADQAEGLDDPRPSCRRYPLPQPLREDRGDRLRPIGRPPRERPLSQHPAESTCLEEPDQGSHERFRLPTVCQRPRDVRREPAVGLQQLGQPGVLLGAGEARERVRGGDRGRGVRSVARSVDERPSIAVG
jgi:hypothetical protein